MAKKTTNSKDEIVALACRFGPMGAVAYRQFKTTLDGLPDDAATYLMRCFSATIDLASGDAGKEVSLLRDALCKLRDEWKEEYDE